MNCLAICALLLAGSTASAATILIDFEHSPGPDGILGTPDDVPTPTSCPFSICGPLGNFDYSAVGVNFSSGQLFVGALFPNAGATNHFSSSSVPDATFSGSVYGITVDSYSFWSLTLYGLNAANQIIASATFNSPTAGTSFQLTTLSIMTSTPMARFTVRPQGCSPSEPTCNQIVNIDNILLATSPAAAIPEPSTAVLLCTPILLWGAVRLACRSQCPSPRCHSGIHPKK